MITIDKKIVGYSVVKKETSPVARAAAPASVLRSRDEMLPGATYKIKNPLYDHAFYVTINDLEGRPFEMFINSKAMEHFQWILALTRVISAVFRSVEDTMFLVGELKCVVDPKGGYFKRGRFIPSLVAEIGDVLETHMKRLGLITVDDSLAVAAQEMVAQKQASKASEPVSDGVKQVCAKCGDSAVVVMDGCMTCTSCGDSKCG